MLTARDGTGEQEAPVDVEQVALFPDAGAATREGTRLAEELRACDARSDLVTVEAVRVGAQGTGVAYRYPSDGGASPFGTYVVLSRRGTALLLVTSDGGEGTPQGARRPVLRRAQQAWELLCRYDSAGC